MKKYDLLRDTWIYQEIQQEVQQEERQRQLVEQRQIVIELVQARYPHLESDVHRVVEQCEDMGVLHTLIVRLGKLRTEKEVRRCLSNVEGARA